MLLNHRTEWFQGSDMTKQDALLLGQQWNVPNAAGAAGAAVTVAVAFEGLPPNYCAIAAANQACAVSITNKTNTGFDVVLTPLSSTAAIAVGTFDVLVTG